MVDIMNKQFEKSDDELRSRIENSLQTAIVEQCRKEVMEEYFYKYEVQLQNIRFITYMSDAELERSIKLTIDLLEEMRVINNGGMDEKEFRKKVADIEKNCEDEFMQQLYTWDILCSQYIAKIISEIDKVRRVGGAYAMLISNPGLKNAIYVVYEVLVDNFDDETLYCQSAFFMLRAIMRMHSEEVKGLSSKKGE